MHIDTNSVSIPNKNVKAWNENINLELIKDDNLLRVKKMSQHNEMSIKLSNGKRHFGLAIERIEQKYGKYYLNVKVERSTEGNGQLDKNHGGLLGDISNKQYVFYNQIQKETAKAAIRINKNLIKSWIKQTSSALNEVCFMVDLKDLLYPKNISSYLKNSIKIE